jgi:hypothetical protein
MYLLVRLLRLVVLQARLLFRAETTKVVVAVMFVFLLAVEAQEEALLYVAGLAAQAQVAHFS